MGTVERVSELVMPIVRACNVDLYDIEHESGVLRITVDRPGGIDVDTIGEVSKQISHALDADDPLPEERYLLEVSSPGVERKLRLPDHFRARIGDIATFKVKREIEGDRRFEARIDSADDEGIEVTVQNNGSSPRHLGYDDIESARIVFQWGSERQALQDGAKTSTKTTNKKASAR